MMRTFLTAVLAAGALAACSSDYDEALASAKDRACQLAEIERQLAAEPADAVLATKAKGIEDLLARDRQASGNPDKLQAAIEAHVAAGCE